MAKRFTTLFLSGIICFSATSVYASSENATESSVMCISEQTLSYKGFELCSDFDGAPAVALFFDYCNASSTPSFCVSSFYIEVYQNGIARDITFPAYEYSHDDECNNATTNIMNGAQLTTCQLYSLEDTSSPLDVKIQNAADGTFDEIGSFQIDLSSSDSQISDVAPPVAEAKDYWAEKYDGLQKDYDELLIEHNTLQNDYSSLQENYDELSQQYEKLQKQLDELSNASSSFSDVPVTPTETNKPVSEEALESASTDATTIFSTDAVSFYKDRNNYYTVCNMAKAGQIEELKVQLNNYASIRPDDKPIIDSTLDVLNQYGDFENIICESDAFSHNELYYYDGYHGIDAEHYIYPYWELNAYGFHLRLGFTNSDWIFATNIYLKRDADGINDGIWFYGKSYEFERTILDSGGIMEYKDEEVSDKYVDYFLGDLSAPMTLRFQSDSDAKLDYVLTDTDKQALQNLAKFTKLLNSVADLSLK